VRFAHPKKILAAGEIPVPRALSDEVVARLYGLSERSYRAIRRRLDTIVRDMAQEIDAEFGCEWSDHAPFKAGDVVLALGDSITDDYQSWAEILRDFLALSYTQMLWTGVKRKAAYLPGC
jgi:acyl-CoA thioesterase I